jgi:hypothetical protein
MGIPRTGGLNFAGQVSEGPAVYNTVILKWDADGNPLWGWVGLSDGNDFLRDITVDNQGRVYSVISTVMSSSFGGQPYTVVPGDWGMVFIRLLPDGTEDRYWLATGDRRSDVFAMVHTADNHIWLGGMQRHITYFPFGALNAGTVDDRQGFICEFNADTDQFEELSRVHGSSWQYIYGGCTNQAGKLYFGGDMSGSFGGPVNFGMQNEIVDNMYIDEKTLPFLARYDGSGCAEYSGVFTNESIDLCQGESVELSPEIPVYGFQWSDGVTHPLVVNVAGDYVIQVIGIEGCIVGDTLSVGVEQLPELIWDAQSISCANADDGVITFAANGPNQPYTIAWNGLPAESPLQGIAAGLYLLQAESAGGCIAEVQIELSQPNPIAITYAINLNGANDLGSIVVETISGGTPPYSIYWPSHPQAEDIITDVPLGSYEVQITDAAGCTQSFEVLLTTGVNDDAFIEFSCYPQPATDVVTITNGSAFTWRLYDNAGREVLAELTPLLRHHVDLSNKPSGAYVLKGTGVNGHSQSIVLLKQ